jgi:DNA-binding NtrC family response regulator
MIGSSIAFRQMLERLERIARYDAAVLIEGETGTGKELAARAIHYRSARRDRPFVPINCGALQDSLIENELFGHRRGAFTDARGDHGGLIEAAQGGTLMLDEIDALSAKGQVSLLRFLEDQQYRPLGGRELRTADVRVLAASNSDLDASVRSGGFRPDLLYRLRVMRLPIPALRERQGDVQPLAEHFIAITAKRYGKPVLSLDATTREWMEAYDWPGNVRELENLVCQALLLSDGPMLTIAPPRGLNVRAPATLLRYREAKAQAVAEFERRFLGQVILRANGNVSEAARLIGTERRHLGRLLKKYGVDRVPALNLREA